MLALFPPISVEFSPWRKPLIGSIFISLCGFGSLAALLPIQCSRIFRNKKRNNNSKQDPFLHSISNGMKGHHPSCGKFNLHTFNIKNRVLCAACVGLFIGGVTTIVGSFFYFLTSWIVIENGVFFVILGILGVSFGFFQQWFRSLIRLSLNFVFVLGSFFILIGIDKIIQSLIIDLFVISLIFFWLFTRISLSHWDHERICSSCGVVNCEFIIKKNRGRI